MCLNVWANLPKIIQCAKSVARSKVVRKGAEMHFVLYTPLLLIEWWVFPLMSQGTFARKERKKNVLVVSYTSTTENATSCKNGLSTGQALLSKKKHGGRSKTIMVYFLVQNTFFLSSDAVLSWKNASNYSMSCLSNIISLCLRLDGHLIDCLEPLSIDIYVVVYLYHRTAARREKESFYNKEVRWQWPFKPSYNHN